MVMFRFTDNEYVESVVLPDKEVCLCYPLSYCLDRKFLCVGFRNQESGNFVFYRAGNYALRPVLSNYKALRYKRQSSIGPHEVDSLLYGIRMLNIPWSDDYVILSKMKSCLDCKRYYVVIACRSGSDDEDSEKVLLLFDRYSDATSMARDYGHRKIKSLLGADFVRCSSWYPYLWVEHMGHPISLLLDIDSHSGSYSVGPSWCYYLTCFLRDGYVKYVSYSSLFGFVFEDHFAKIIHYGK